MNMLNKDRISKNRLLLLGTFIFLIVLSIPTFFWIKNANHDLAERRKSQMSPVIMIPGSSATTERFNELVNLLNKDTLKKHSLLKIQVKKDGTLLYNALLDFEKYTFLLPHYFQAQVHQTHNSRRLILNIHLNF